MPILKPLGNTIPLNVVLSHSLITTRWVVSNAGDKLLLTEIKPYPHTFLLCIFVLLTELYLVYGIRNDFATSVYTLSVTNSTAASDDGGGCAVYCKPSNCFFLASYSSWVIAPISRSCLNLRSSSAVEVCSFCCLVEFSSCVFLTASILLQI